MLPGEKGDRQIEPEKNDVENAEDRSEAQPSEEIPSEPAAGEEEQPPTEKGRKGLVDILVAVGILLITACTCLMVALVVLKDVPASLPNTRLRPVVVIDSPSNRSSFQVGEEVSVISTITDRGGVARVELWVNDVQQDTEPDPIPQNQRSLKVRQTWTPETAGLHTLEVRAYNTAGRVNAPAFVTVEAVEISTPVAQAPTSTPTSTTTATPTATPTQSATPTRTPTSLPTPPTTDTPTATETPTDTPTPTPVHSLGYGANLSSADQARDLAEMGFDWAKGFLSWEQAGTGPKYHFADVDNQMREIVKYVDHVLIRLNWPVPGGVGNPPRSPGDLDAFRAMAEALARHCGENWRPKGLKTIAYEVWNEPNLKFEWGGNPNPAEYVALLKAGYQGIKAGDPEALVISGAVSSGGDYDDLAFIQAMYDAGAKPYFDALGSHPYGGSYPPDTPLGQTNKPVYFRRAEQQYQIMVNNGDGHKQVWATEFSWIVHRPGGCGQDEHTWAEVSEDQQALYLVEAYRYAAANWPWMGPMFLMMGFGCDPWRGYCESLRWYSIFYREDAPALSPIIARPAVEALTAMEKHLTW